MPALAVLKTIELRNDVRFFSQKVQDPIVLPVPLTEKQDLSATIQIDESLTPPSLRKVFTKAFAYADLKVTIEIYHFNQNNEKYFSQQVILFKNDQLIAKCTSYFPETQAFLVPGVCSGVVSDTLWGLSVFRK